MKIVFTGGSGRFGKIFKSKTKLKNVFYPNKKELNILNISSIKKYLSKKKPKIVIHAAGLSRPMDMHEKDINQSIDELKEILKQNFATDLAPLLLEQLKLSLLGL